jgi:hypothetical protein
MKRFQNRVAESSLSLPVSAIICILIWLAAGLVSRKLWVPLLLTGFSTYLIAEMNNRNALLRIRSRMMSCVFLWLATMQATITTSWQTITIQALMELCTFLLLFCYRDKTEVPSIFCIALIISVGSIIWAPFLYFLPVIFILLCTPLYAMSFKAVSAIIMGLILPHWALIPYFVYKENVDWLKGHYKLLYDGSVFFDYSSTTVGHIVCYAILLILMLIGWIHFVRTAYKDKLKTRTLYDVIITLAAFFAVIVPIFPTYADYTLAMLTIAISPLAAHYFSLTSTKLTNIVFIIVLAILAMVVATAIGTEYFENLVVGN